jgi:hypothetical protein
VSKFANSLAHLAAAVLVGAVLVASAQPILTDDLWWHLALGESYATSGPWLEADPLLFTATGPPTPSAWLFDVAAHGLERVLGFSGLRVAHAGLAACLFALAWLALRRASGSPLLASVGVIVFAPLCAFRVFQLRPHLFTIIGALLLYRLLFASPRAPSALRIGATVLLFGIWANLHSGFLLGPILLGAGLSGVVVAACLGPPESRAAQRSRALALGVALLLGGLATLVNPSGWEPHTAYFIAGEESPALTRVGDEWAPFHAFRFPNSPLPPSPLGWLIVWALGIATLIAAAASVFASRREASQADRIDFASVALALAWIPATLIAVRFTWLAIFPILLLVRVASTRFRAPLERPLVKTAIAVGAVALAAAFFSFGAWRSMSTGLARSVSQYVESDYPAGKWFSHGVWFLSDTGVEGNLFNDYFMGGYIGFWSSPRIMAFQNGTLNIPLSAHAAMVAIRGRSGLPEGGLSFEELLDDYEVDLVFGMRLPERQRGPWHYTTGLMERAPGWMLVFRNLRSSVYLRNNARNQANLERIERYYAEADVPFDRSVGFEPRRVLREAPRWAQDHGIAPIQFDSLVAATQARDVHRMAEASNELAPVYASLGLYEDALRVDERLLRLRPEARAPWRRKLFSLIRLDRAEEARAAAESTLEWAEPGSLVYALAIEAKSYAELEDPEARAAMASRSTFLAPREAARLRSKLMPPKSRTP